MEDLSLNVTELVPKKKPQPSPSPAMTANGLIMASKSCYPTEFALIGQETFSTHSPMDLRACPSFF